MSHPITLDLSDLLNLLTYNKLFDNISLVNFPHITSLIEAADRGKELCFVSRLQDNHPILWTCEGWINEKKRLEKMEQAEKENELRRIEAEKNKPSNQIPKTPEERDKLIREAIAKGDFNRVIRLKMGLK